jgi:hypothetical protein
MPHDNYITNEQAGDYLRNWIKKVKEEMKNNPEAFQTREPGLYIGGIKVKDGDKLIYDSEGLPFLIRKGCCE